MPSVVWPDAVYHDGVAEADRTSRNPDGLTTALGLTFGADPSWTPAREAGMVRTERKDGQDIYAGGVEIEFACDLATREVMIVQACGVCRATIEPTTHRRYPCAACLEMVQDSRIRWLLAQDGAIPDSDDQANAAVSKLADRLGEEPWLKGIQVESSEADPRSNVAVVQTTRKLKRHERELIPAQMDGVGVVLREPDRKR